MALPRAPAFNAPLIYVGSTLSSARLELEPLTAAHAESMFAGLADRSLYRWMHVDPPGDADELRGRFERVANPYARTGEIWLNWALRERETATHSGLIEATVRADRMVHLTFYVFPARQRNGLGREACAAVIDHLWRAYDAAEIRCEMDYRNVPARCLVERLGFARRSHPATRRVGDDVFTVYGYRLKRP